MYGKTIPARVLADACRAVVLCCGLLVSPAWAATPLQPRVESARDAVRVVASKRNVAIEITSPGGIGRMTIPAPARGAWPAALSLRLRHGAGRPFTRLEGLDLSVAGQVAVRREDVVVRTVRGWLVVDVPARVLRPGEPLHVQWVDAYR